MKQKPEALRLADILEKMLLWDCDRETAAELRRQHTEIEQLREKNTALNAACAKLEKERDELQDGLKCCMAFLKPLSPVAQQ